MWGIRLLSAPTMGEELDQLKDMAGSSTKSVKCLQIGWKLECSPGPEEQEGPE